MLRQVVVGDLTEGDPTNVGDPLNEGGFKSFSQE